MILVVSATGMVDGMIPVSFLDQERQARALVWSPDSVDRLGARGAETLWATSRTEPRLSCPCSSKPDAPA